MFEPPQFDTCMKNGIEKVLSVQGKGEIFLSNCWKITVADCGGLVYHRVVEVSP